MSASMTARVLLPHLWTEAWDDGVFEWKPIVLKARIFPADNVGMDELLAELVALNFIKRVEIGGKAYGLIRNFRRYQRPKKPNKSPINTEPYTDYLGPVPKQFHTGSVPEEDEFPTGPEMSPQMEDGGGNRRRKRESSQQQQHSEPRAPAAQEAAPPPAAAEQFDPKAADDLMARLRAAGGYEHNPAPGLFVIGPIQALMAEGFDLDREILPVIRAKAMTMTRPAQSWAYFVPMIREQRDKANSSSGTRNNRSGETRPALMSEIDRREKQRGHIAEALAKSGVDPSTELGCRKIVAGFAAEQWFEVFREGQPFSPALLPLDMAWLKQHLSDTNVLMSLAYHQRPEFGRLRALAEMSGATIPASFRELASMLEDTIEENGPPADYLGLMAQAPRHGMPAPPTSEAA